jgi:hypothetical protein
MSSFKHSQISNNLQGVFYGITGLPKVGSTTTLFDLRNESGSSDHRSDSKAETKLYLIGIMGTCFDVKPLASNFSTMDIDH